MLCCAALLAAARADDPPAGNPRCLPLTTIDHTEAVTDRDILFYMKDRTIYRNALPQTCPGLSAGKPFSYRVPLNQLCDTDTITLLDEQGRGFVPTQTCLLGKFESIEPDGVEALRNEQKANEQRRRVR
jgi:hypothetical protein